MGLLEQELTIKIEKLKTKAEREIKYRPSET